MIDKQTIFRFGLLVGAISGIIGWELAGWLIYTFLEK